MTPDLPEDWRRSALADVVELQRGFDLPAHSRVPGPYPVLTSGEGGGWHNEGPIEGPGFIVGRATNLGKPKWSSGPFWPHNTTMFAKDFRGNDPRWLFHLFEATDLSGFDSGSVQPMLNRNYIAQVPVAVPPLAEQGAIAEVLEALDAKIAANFDLASSADLLLAAEFEHRLYAVEMCDKPLSAIANVVLGGTPSRARIDYWTEGTVPWLNSGALNATRVVKPSALITPLALANSAAKLMPVGSTLLAITGATLGQIARLEMRASGNQSIVGVWSDDVALNTWLYFAIQSRLDNLLARATGAAQQHVSKADVEQLAVPIPSRAILEGFGEIATPLLELAAVAERENSTLALTRDALLPQLMSGKLRVRDAEAAASEAGA